MDIKKKKVNVINLLKVYNIFFMFNHKIIDIVSERKKFTLNEMK